MSKKEKKKKTDLAFMIYDDLKTEVVLTMFPLRQVSPFFRD